MSRFVAKTLSIAALTAVVGGVCLPSVPVVLAAAPEAGPPPIALKSRTLHAPVDHRGIAGDVVDIASRGGKHVIVQFDEIPDAATRKELAASGLKLLQYLGDKGWYASVADDADEAALDDAGLVGAWAIEPADRIAPNLGKGQVPEHARRAGGNVAVSVIAFADTDLDELRAAIEAQGGAVESVLPEFDMLFVQVHQGALADLADLDGVQWIEPVSPMPKPEMDRARAYLKTGTVQASPYSLTGSGVKVAVHDDNHAFQHNDYLNRWIKGDTDPLSVGIHPSMTAGTIAGDGTGNINYKGMAPAATIVTYDYATGGNNQLNRYGDIADGLTRGVEIANNSWGYSGCGISVGLPYGDYTAEARVYDMQVRGQDSSGQQIGNPTTVVFSAGNERSSYFDSNTQSYKTDCIAEKTRPYRNYGTINQPKPAKNIIAVGGIDSLNDVMSTYSSWGPTSDGRLKPEIVAAGMHAGFQQSAVSSFSTGPTTGQSMCFGDPFGASNQQCYRATADTNTNNTGTSYDDRYGWFSQTSAAAAMVSGNAALFIQDFRAKNSKKTPLPSTVKAHFVHTARDLSDATEWYNPGPDYASGYGVLDIKAAIDQMRTGRWVESNVDHGAIRAFQIQVPDGTTTLKVTLAWDDPPSAPATTAAALVNDLDLLLYAPDGSWYYPWTLNPADPDADAVRNLPDHRNNLEVVYLDAGTFPAGVPAGVWTVQVKGTSVPAGPQYYSVVFSEPRVPTDVDMIVSALTTPTYVTPGASVSISDTTKNQGLSAGPATLTRFYWSTNTTYEVTDKYLGSRSIPALGAGGSSGPTSTLVNIPSVADGSYYILAIADGGDAVLESVETNNLKYKKVSVGPDLIISALTGPATGSAGQLINVNDTTKNSGSTAAGASYTRFYFSLDTKCCTGDTYLGERAVTGLAAGASSGPAATAVTLPSPLDTGTYYILAVADGRATITETSETNNIKSLKILVGPDLIVSTLKQVTGAVSGGHVVVSEATKNQGGGSALDSATRFYWSDNTTYEAGTDAYMGYRAIGALKPGEISGPVNSELSVPVTFLGTHYILAVADADKKIIETSETNNVKSLKVVVGPDLYVPTLTTSATTVAPGQWIDVTDTTKNQGSMTANASLTQFYWSTDTVCCTGDGLLASRNVPALAAGGVSGPVKTQVQIPGAAGGSYYILAKADGTGVVDETSETNNVKSKAMTIAAPDLSISTVAPIGSVSRGSAVTVTDTTANTGTATAPASLTGFYLSVNATFDVNDVLLATRNVPSLAAQTTNTGSVSGTIPANAPPGVYYVIAVADYNKAITELSETNNAFARAVTVTY